MKQKKRRKIINIVEIKKIEKLLNLFRSAWEWIVFRSIKEIIKELLLDIRSIGKIIKKIELKFHENKKFKCWKLKRKTK